MVGSLHEERARNLGGGEPADEAQGERGARLGGQKRMARQEDESQQVITDDLIGRALDRAAAELLFHLKLVPERVRTCRRAPARDAAGRWRDCGRSP